MNKQLGICKQFLLENGWELNNDGRDNFYSFWKDGCIGVDFTTEGDMVFIGERGDFLHKKLDYHALIGVLLEHRQLPINYNSVIMDRRHD